jgi:hypothetical protein
LQPIAAQLVGIAAWVLFPTNGTRPRREIVRLFNATVHGAGRMDGAVPRDAGNAQTRPLLERDKAWVFPTTMTPSASTTIGWRKPNSAIDRATASTA